MQTTISDTNGIGTSIAAAAQNACAGHLFVAGERILISEVEP
jgi:hypothetical protein